MAILIDLQAAENRQIEMAADTVIADSDNIVPIGVISPDHIVTPAPVVDYLVTNT